MYGSWGLGLGPMFLAGPTEAAGLDVGLMPCLRIFYIYIYYITILQKYIVRHKILQKYTSCVVAHDIRDITPWAAALGAARSGP
jgi:hypothetical protein